MRRLVAGVAVLVLFLCALPFLIVAAVGAFFDQTLLDTWSRWHRALVAWADPSVSRTRGWR